MVRDNGERHQRPGYLLLVAVRVVLYPLGPRPQWFIQLFLEFIGNV